MNSVNSRNTQKVLMATCLIGVIGGLFGLGLLIRYRYQQKQPSAKSDKETAPEQSSRSLPKKQATLAQTINPKKNQIEKTPLIVNPQKKRKSKRVERKIDQAPRSNKFPLRLGSKGKRVERLRIWLMRNYGWTGIISDEFDKQTERLLKRYLKATQLDEATYHRLKMGEDHYGKS